MSDTVKTIAELEAELAAARDRENKKLVQAKQAYEKDRDDVVYSIVNTAQALAKELLEFKTNCHIKMDTQAVKLSQYGKIRSNSKGGFNLTHSDGEMRVTRRRDTEPAWDERSLKAIELIKDFLGDTIKKRDIKIYEILIGFLERNDKGDLEYGRVMDLYQHEDKFDDERWKEGLRLIKESYSNHMKGYGYEFKIKGSDGKWQSILLNFSSI
ncbi:DUF3164 family protein [Flavobacterium cerinum]|uniref:DUF3164 family protein n=1 Tax=Flavobacterium cerinum TaxID=2502784 RepID=A0A444HBT5_9FLAO|nr:DUF3164 family protein [Flavobacterium cerinum]RWX00948.1 DUF3164 family protein [Flavobacterium cerinum]